MKFSGILRAGTAVILAGALCGCSIKFGTETEPKPDAVVAYATTGDAADKLKITYADFKKEYYFYLKGRGIEDDTASNVASTCKTQRETIINYLINECIIGLKAKELGISELTSEEMDKVESEYNSQIDEQVSYYGENADYGEETSVSDEEKNSRGNEDFDAFLAECGLTREDLLIWSTNSMITEKMINEIGKDLDRADAEKTFNEYVEKVKALYEDNTSQYEQGGFTSVWVPEGSRLIKHILIGFEGTVSDEITLKRKNGDDAGANALREEKAAELQSKVDEVQKKLDDGEEFKKIMLQYSSDAAGSSMYPDGYVVIPKGTRYMAEFQEAAFVPEKKGDRTVCVTDYGVHIMIYADDAKVSDDVKKAYIDEIFEQQMQVKFAEKMDEWKAEYNFKIDYEALRLDAPAESSGSSGIQYPSVSAE